MFAIQNRFRTLTSLLFWLEGHLAFNGFGRSLGASLSLQKCNLNRFELQRQLCKVFLHVFCSEITWNTPCDSVTVAVLGSRAAREPWRSTLPRRSEPRHSNLWISLAISYSKSMQIVSSHITYYHIIIVIISHQFLVISSSPNCPNRIPNRSLSCKLWSSAKPPIPVAARSSLLPKPTQLCQANWRDPQRPRPPHLHYHRQLRPLKQSELENWNHASIIFSISYSISSWYLLIHAPSSSLGTGIWLGHCTILKKKKSQQIDFVFGWTTRKAGFTPVISLIQGNVL
jgi:hypothetical protein